jgi:hypothetical protein
VLLSLVKNKQRKNKVSRDIKMLAADFTRMMVSKTPKQPNRQQASRANRRSRGARNSPGLATTTPTTDQLEVAMRRAFKGRQYGDPWIECRLDTFNSIGGGGKPDGRNSRFVVVDHLVANTLVTSSGGFKIWTFPGCLPCTAAATGIAGATNDLTIDGYPYVTGTGNFNFYPIGIPPEWNNVVRQPGSSGDDPFFSSKARVVAVKRRLIYIGSTFNNQGLIQVTPLAAGFGMSTGFTSGTVTGTIRDGAATANPTISTGVQIINVDLNQQSLFTKDSVTCRIEQGIEIVSKQGGDIHSLVPSWDNYPMVVVNQTSSGTTGVVNLFTYTGTGSTPSGQSTWGIVDPTWIGEEIVVSGAAAGSAFRFETAICVEYQLASNSPMISMSKRKSDLRPNAVATAHNMAQAMPVAKPGYTFSDPRR